jgi:hypothetical protein
VFQSLFLGNSYALAFGCLIWLVEVWEGISSGDFSDFEPTSIVVLPALGYFFGEAMTQYTRWQELGEGSAGDKP